ncbi:MAG: endonuclease/exonuclease/phosphatase family protein [Bacteroidota bacterium]|nr:endonuclease/exonuclease/phosphatase family protein [Bacteroidota bacterium]
MRRILIFVNIGIGIIYLLACLVPFVDAGKNWFIALAGLGFPLLFFALMGFIILWAILKSKCFWVSIIVLLFGFQQIISSFAFNIPKKFSLEKQQNVLRVMQWNVCSWDESDLKDNGTSFRPLMMDIVNVQNSDVLCFEEFFEPPDTKSSGSIISTITQLGFPYHFYVPSYLGENDHEQGVAIFSKFPITDTALFSLDKNNLGEHLIYADIKVKARIFRIYCTHLQSVHFEGSEYEGLSKLKRARDPGFHESKTIVSKLKTGYEFRYRQSELVKQKIAESPYPAVICGDFNDVPNSNTYFEVKGNLQDAFLKSGFGIGRSFRYISPTLRIDYILADKKFKVTQFQTIHVPYSDHYPIEADLQY